MSEETKKCPFCGEEIKAEAVKCRFCQTNLKKNATEEHLSGQNPAFYVNSGLNIKRLLGGLLIYPLGCAVSFNILLWLTGSWWASSSIVGIIVLLVLLLIAVGFTLGYLKFARARGFLASGLIIILMALPVFNVAGLLVAWPLSFRSIGTGGAIIELIFFYLLWGITVVGMWIKNENFYCLNCKKWSNQTYVSDSLEGIADIESLKKQLSENNIKMLTALKDSGPDDKNNSRFTIQHCSCCGDAYLSVIATQMRPFRGPIRELKYILKDPALGSTTAGTMVELEDTVIKGQLLSKENFAVLKERCKSVDGLDAQ